MQLITHFQIALRRFYTIIFETGTDVSEFQLLADKLK
jgi:hypothetical protein